MLSEKNEYRFNVKPGEKVDGWVVGEMGRGVWVFNIFNHAVPSDANFPDGIEVAGGVRLCVDSAPGQIYHALGTLNAGQQCVLRWCDIADHHDGSTEPDSYAVRIDIGFRGELSNSGLEKIYIAESAWRGNALIFKPKTTAEYYVSFTEKKPETKHGSVVSNVSLLASAPSSENDIQQLNQSLQLVYDGQTGLARSVDAWMFRVSGDGESPDGRAANFRLNGDNIHFAGKAPGESWQAVIKLGQVELAPGTVLSRGNGGALSLSVNVGAASRTFPITVAGGTAKAGWKLALTAGEPETALDVGGSFLFVFTLTYHGDPQSHQTLLVAEKTVDARSPFETVPVEIATLANGQAQLPLVAARSGSSTITITHAASNAQVALKLEVVAANARKYQLELARPGGGKLAVNRQELVQIRVLDAVRKTPTAAEVKVTARIDAQHDGAKMMFHAKEALASSGMAEFLATATVLGTSNVVFQTDPAAQAAPLPVALTAQTSVSVPQLRVAPEEVELLPDSLDDKQAVHVFFDPVPETVPEAIDFEVQERESSLRVRQGNLQQLAGSLKIGGNGEAVLSALQLGAESGGKVLHIRFSAGAAGARPCILNVKVKERAVSAKLLPDGVATQAVPLVVDWSAAITLSGCYVLVDGQQAGVPVSFHLIGDREALAEFADAGTAAERSSRTVKTGAAGRAALPDIQTGAMPGKFRVDVYLAGNPHILGTFHFSVEQPLAAQLLVFGDDQYGHLSPGQAFKADYVTVYADLPRSQTLHGGTVQFVLDDSGKTGSRFVQAGGKPALQATASISPYGRALLPDIRLGGSPGGFSVTATVSTQGIVLLVQSKNYTIASF
ncbi:hypothetical protein [Chromobacterium sp. ATCC 53434]|uniref:hypothetical protein n=1 Tax=Chromobacterium sp. (strain ATCC 53434 / SC 14030) TaxID=2059672 RepID=UPI001305217F|nr:hypothetical protein [Chromobacterium sp. ATCC 53434]